jgi:multiple sugar transport system permease protein
MWGFLYSPDLSPFSRLTGTVDVLSADLVLWAMANVVTWVYVGYNMLIIYSSLLAIPAEVYEAAQLDGAGAVATLTRITLPLLRRILFIALLFRTLDALRSFDLMFVLTGGGPAGTTETLTVYAYRSLFQAVQLGLGSAVGVVVFALVMLVAWVYLRALRSQGLTT